MRGWVSLPAVFAFGLAAIAQLMGPAPSAGADEPKPKTLSFGVFPYLGATRLEAIFAPLAASLGRELERPVTYRSAGDFKEFRERLRRAEYDVAFVQPFDYVLTGAPAGYLPLARVAEDLQAVLVSRHPRPETSFAELSGVRIGVPPPSAAIALLTRAALVDAGHDPAGDIHLVHLASHDSCLQQVLIDEVDLCATAPLPLRQFEQRIGVRLHAVARTRAIPSALFVAHERLPVEERATLRRQLLAPEFADRVPFFEKGLIPTHDIDYAPLRSGEWAALSGKSAFGAVLPFGVLPSLPIRQLEALSAPVAAALGRQIGIPVQVRTSRSPEQFLAHLRRGDYALAVVQPFDCPLISDRYRPLARFEESLEGLFVTRRGESMESFEALRNRVIAVPPDHTAITRLARCALRQAGLDPDRDVSLLTTDNRGACLEMLATRRVDVCVTASFALQVMEAAERARFEVALRSPAIHNVVIVAHRDLPEPLSAAVRNLLLHWTDSTGEERPEILASASDLTVAVAEDYEAYRVVDANDCPTHHEPATGLGP